MMSSVGLKTAVSSYEHLNRKTPHSNMIENHDIDNSKNTLPRKPKKPDQVSTDKNIVLNEMINVNNSGVYEPGSVKYYATGQSKSIDDIEQRVNSVPVPAAFSPGMFPLNPSLFITPQKSVSDGFDMSAKENIIEPHSENKIPKPVAWSPGMVIQPNPSLFITPEKSVEKKISSKFSSRGKEAVAEKGNLKTDNAQGKTKESYSVRFDVPSSTSEDEANDPLSESDSPITLRGCEIDSGLQQFESPVWKAFSPQKTYNPGAYSDESSFDESILSLPTLKNSSKTDHKNANKSDSVSHNSSIEQKHNVSTFPEDASGILSNQCGTLKQGRQNEADQCSGLSRKKVTSSSSAYHKSVKMKPPKSNVRGKVDYGGSKTTVKAGPQFLSSPLAPLESPPASSAVIREMKDNLLSKEYSYPFEQKTISGDLEYEHVFARPEFNSTLKVRAELDALCEQEVDVKKTLENTLAKSEIKRTELNEKAAAYTNRLSNQFKNLIDLNTSVESLCDRVVRMRTTKIPSKRRDVPTEKKSSELKAPDLMEFFTNDLQKECPDLSLPGVNLVGSQLVTSPPDLSFDLYRHNRLWEGLYDF